MALALAGVRLLLPDEPIVPGLLVLDGLLLLVVARRLARSTPAPGRIAVERTMPVVLTIDAAGRDHVAHRRTRRAAGCASASPTSSRRRCMRRCGARRVHVPADGSTIVRTAIRPSRRGRFVPSEVVGAGRTARSG